MRNYQSFRIGSAIIGFALFCAQPYVAILTAAISDNLVSCWTMDEASGTRNDSAANANHLTDNNTVAAGTAHIGTQSADFELSNAEYFSRASNSSLQMGDIDFTICAWINLESLGVSQMIVAKDDDAASSRDYTLLVDSSDVLVFYVNGGAGSISVVTIGTVSVSTWHFVCAGHDAAANLLKIQLDDGAVETFATGGIVPDVSAAEFRIGAREYAAFENYFDGRIDEVAIWKRWLSDAERTEMYNSGTGRACAYVLPGAATSHPNTHFIGFTR